MKIGQHFLSLSKIDTHYRLYELTAIVEGVTNSHILHEIHTGEVCEVEPEWFNQRRIELVNENVI